MNGEANDPKTSALDRFVPSTGRAFALGVTVALFTLGLTVLAGWWLVRSLVRQQIVQRDAEALHATTLMEQLDIETDESDNATTGIEELVGFEAALRASRLRGVVGIRFFDANGNFRDAFPATIQPAPLPGKAATVIKDLKPYATFKELPLDRVFIYLPQFSTGNIPRIQALEVTVPLHRRDNTNLAGAAQFVVDGSGVAAEYRRLDRHLGTMAVVVFGAGGSLLVAMLWPAFRRLARINRELAERNTRLAHANRELALAARATALGAVSGHLMHGLKNPLASLTAFIRSCEESGNGHNSGEAQEAVLAARRMQNLVEQTLEVIADAGGAPGYEVDAVEMAEAVQKRVTDKAQRKGVRLECQVLPGRKISSRTANLVGLVLTNLMENGIEAVPAGGMVRLVMSIQDGTMRFRVEDNGPGFPEHLRKGIFLPCHSTRPGGSGIGLAISKQLADYLGGQLELKESSAGGCAFELQLKTDSGGTQAFGR